MAMPEDEVYRLQKKAAQNTSPSGNALRTVTQNQPRNLKTFKPASRPGETVDLSGFRDAIGNRPNEVFRLNEMRGLMNQQQQAGGGNIPIGDPRFQTPEHLGSTIQQIMQMLQPQTDARLGQHEADYNRMQQLLQNSLAAQGSLRGGGAVSQQQDALSQMLRGADSIRAEQQANAVPLALQYGQLGLQESGQQFDQNMANRQFEQARSQQAVANMLASLGFQEEQIQNYIRNTQALTGMDMAQSQWSQQFGLDRQQNDFNRWLQTQNLNSANQANWMDGMLRASGLSEQARQFDMSHPLAIAQLTGMYNGSPTMAMQGMGTDFMNNLMNRSVNFPQGMGDVLGGVAPGLAGFSEMLNTLGGQQNLPAWQTQQNNAASMSQAMLPWTMGMTPYQQAQIDADWGRINASGQSSKEEQETLDRIRGYMTAYGTDMMMATYIDDVLDAPSVGSATTTYANIRRNFINELSKIDPSILYMPQQQQDLVLRQNGLDVNPMLRAIRDKYNPTGPVFTPPPVNQNNNQNQRATLPGEVRPNFGTR